jgi:hypothetical protein
VLCRKSKKKYAASIRKAKESEEDSDSDDEIDMEALLEEIRKR